MVRPRKSPAPQVPELRRELRNRGWSNRQLAEYLGVTECQAIRLAGGTNALRFGVACELALVLGPLAIEYEGWALSLSPVKGVRPGGQVHQTQRAA